LPAVDGRYISGPRYVFMHRHKVDKTYGILRLVYSATDENLAVSGYDKRYRFVESTRIKSRTLKVITKAIKYYDMC